jgi:hypothetical protein
VAESVGARESSRRCTVTAVCVVPGFCKLSLSRTARVFGEGSSRKFLWRDWNTGAEDQYQAL